MGDFMIDAEGFRIPVLVYWLLLVVLLCGGAYLLFRYWKKQRLQPRTVWVYLLMAAPLALIFGRLIYVAIRFDWLFYDNIGNFVGFLPLFDPSVGRLNAIGILTGCLLAGFATAGITKQLAGEILDGVVPYGVLLFALIRFAEPIIGQGYGDLMDQPLFSLYPFGILNDWGDWQLPVCAIEGLLSLIVSATLFGLRGKTRKPGTLTLYCFALLGASQIVPQSFRQDDVLTIFVFARVNQIGFMTFLCGSMLYAGAAALRRGVKKLRVMTEWALMALGVLLAIWCEYALDKVNLPDLLIYAVMAAVIAGMAAMAVRRIHMEDRA